MSKDKKFSIPKGAPQEVHVAARIFEGVKDIDYDLRNADKSRPEAEIAGKVSGKVFDVLEDKDVEPWLFERVAEMDQTKAMDKIRNWWSKRSAIVQKVLLFAAPASFFFRPLVQSGLIPMPEETLVNVNQLSQKALKWILRGAAAFFASPEFLVIEPIATKLMGRQTGFYTKMRAHLRNARAQRTGQTEMFPNMDGMPDERSSSKHANGGSIWNASENLA